MNGFDPINWKRLDALLAECKGTVAKFDAAAGTDLSGKAAVERLFGPRCTVLPTRRAASCFSSCANTNKQICTTECIAMLAAEAK